MAEANNVLPHPSGMSVVMFLKAGPPVPQVLLQSLSLDCLLLSTLS